MKQPLFIACADLHLSSKAPSCRDQKTWLDDMKNVVRFVKEEARKKGVPILFAGDLFDKPVQHPSVEAISLGFSPQAVLAIPGQHDLPYHDLEALDRSSMGVFSHFFPVFSKGESTTFVQGKPFNVTGYGFGVFGKADKQESSGDFHIAMTHEMAWHREAPYPGVEKTSNISNLVPARFDPKEFDMVISGDNHNPFEAKVKGITWINCGAMMKRNIDQKKFEPSIVLVYDDLSFERIPIVPELDVVLLETENKIAKQCHDDAVVRYVQSLKDRKEWACENFETSVLRALEMSGIEEVIKETIKECLSHVVR